MSEENGPSAEQSVEIVNQRGLHARASARLAAQAGAFTSQITICKDNSCVTATSIMGLMMLGAAKGDTVTVSASGPDASDALETVVALIADRFGEDQ